MKISDLRRPLKEFSSGGAVGGGAVASTAGGLGNVAPTVKAQKKKRKLRNGQAVLAREARESIDDLYTRGYHEGRQEGFLKGQEYRKSWNGDSRDWNPEFNEPHIGSPGRVTRANAQEAGYKVGYQDGYHSGTTGGTR